MKRMIVFVAKTSDAILFYTYGYVNISAVGVFFLTSARDKIPRRKKIRRQK